EGRKEGERGKGRWKEGRERGREERKGQGWKEGRKERDREGGKKGGRKEGRQETDSGKKGGREGRRKESGTGKVERREGGTEEGRRKRDRDETIKTELFLDPTFNLLPRSKKRRFMGSCQEGSQYCLPVPDFIGLFKAFATSTFDIRNSFPALDVKPTRRSKSTQFGGLLHLPLLKRFVEVKKKKPVGFN
ncbi:Cyclic nucleotide-gated cation channel beta-1, partial [Ophiophagus hannah]